MLYQGDSSRKDIRELLHKSLPLWLNILLFPFFGLLLFVYLCVLLGFIVLIYPIQIMVKLGMRFLIPISHGLKLLFGCIGLGWLCLTGHGWKKNCCVCGWPAEKTLETYYQKQRHFCKTCYSNATRL